MAQEKAEADVQFGARLKRARDEAGLSTVQLADALFLKRESVDRYMRGERRPSAELVGRWEELCELEPDSLVNAHARLPPRRAAFGQEPSDSEPTSDTGVAEPNAPVRAPVAAQLPSPVRRRAAAGAGIAIAAAVAIAGFVIGQSGTPAPAGAIEESLASTGDVQFRVPASWLRTSRDVTSPHVRLSHPIVVAADIPRGAGVMAGISNGTGRTLLPGPVLERLGEPRPRGIGEALGQFDAYRYPDLRLAGFSGSITFYVVPTSIGVLTLVCFATARDSPHFQHTCQGVARSMRLRRGESFPLGPSRSYQRSLDSVLARLNASRRSVRATLKAAHTPQQQASLAEQLSKTFGDAHRLARRIRVSPRELALHGRILRSIDSTRSAYERLAHAAQHRSVARFNHAAAAVRKAERQLHAAIRALSRLGYPATKARP